MSNGRPWVFDLVASDDAVRGQALARHQTLVAASSAGLVWFNDAWARAGWLPPAEPHVAAEMDQAVADYRWHRDQTIFGYLDQFMNASPGDVAVRTVYGPFVTLFLRWEADYPTEWRSPDSHSGSPWTYKEVLLRQLGRHGVPEEIKPETAELIVAALQRPYRCKDWWYGRSVRHVADAGFHDKVTALLEADDPLVRLRARFVLDLVDHPEWTVKRPTWRRWLDLDRG